MIETVKVEIPTGEIKEYPIIIGENLLKDSGTFIKNHTKAQKVLVVTNKTVYSLYGETVKESLNKESIEYDFFILEDGEKYKNIESLEALWQKALELKLERKDAIIALGGGVTGDLTGFVAATYLRGIDFIQIPTTLLAQVDSSVGGKVAVNHKLGKNLIGAFYQPKLVLSDINTLSTLSVEELKVGLAEVIKYGFIEKSCNLLELNFNFINYLETKKDKIFALDLQTMSELIAYCCKLKARVVKQDEKEAGLRVILNFGHTIGHAVEKCSNYENINHGQAVAIGIKGAFYIAKGKNLIKEDYMNSALNLIDLYGLNYKIPAKISIENLMDAMLLDKKVESKRVRFVLPVNEGEVAIFNDVENSLIESVLKKLY
ncbi:MAG: 3-dehydroquinate synthase [Candidatus Gastranaerophilales bacterium]|nr:3-dehydroquinate synthase [Candidatus Gastranaerophilales bacterium]